MGRTLVAGDVHAMYGRLRSALSAAEFNPDEDTLYAVGDFCDRGPEPLKTLELLMGLPHFHPVVGNHDIWLYEYLCGNGPAPIWLDPRNGGLATYSVIKDAPEETKEKIRNWYGSFPFLRTSGNHIILHAGPPECACDSNALLAMTDGLTLGKAFQQKCLTGTYTPLVHDIVWDRKYIRTAMSGGEQEDARLPFPSDMTIVCGHTPLEAVFSSSPYHLTCIDTGSYDPSGHITLMDLETHRLYQSA